MKESEKKHCSHFVADGESRIRDHERPRITREVWARHAKEFANAGLAERLRIRWTVRCEIEAELDRLAPPYALYAGR